MRRHGNKRVQAVFIDDGQFNIAVERSSGRLLPHMRIFRA